MDTIAKSESLTKYFFFFWKHNSFSVVSPTQATDTSKTWARNVAFWLFDKLRTVAQTSLMTDCICTMINQFHIGLKQLHGEYQVWGTDTTHNEMTQLSQFYLKPIETQHTMYS